MIKPRLLTLAFIMAATVSGHSQTPTPSPTPLYPATVTFADPVSTAALVGSNAAWSAPAVAIQSVSDETAIFRLATAYETEGVYPMDARVLACPAVGTTPVEVAAEIRAYVLQPVSPARKLAGAKRKKLAEISLAADAAIAQGFASGDNVYGIAAADQSNWVAALTALQNAEKVGDINDTTDATAILGPLLDIHGHPVGSRTVLQFRQLMSDLSVHVGALRGAYLTKVAQVQDATTVEEVAAVEP